MTQFERSIASISVVARFASMSSQERRQAMFDHVEKAKKLTGKRLKRAELGNVEASAMLLAKGHRLAQARDLAAIAVDLKNEGLMHDPRADEHMVTYRRSLEMDQRLHQSMLGESNSVREVDVFEQLLLVPFNLMVKAFDAAEHIALITRAFRLFIGSDEVAGFAVAYWESKGWDSSFLTEWNSFTQSLIAEATVS